MRKKLRNDLLARAVAREVTKMLFGSVISVTITLLVFKYLIWS